MEIIGFASDHAGFGLKTHIKSCMEAKGYPCRDFGTDSPASCDYPDYAHPLAKAIEAGEVDCGIALCGSGNGVSMTLNKYPDVRAAVCWNEEIARLARAHNDANALVLPARFMDADTADAVVDMFLRTPFEGGRHQLRIDKIPIRSDR
ncbi:MAG: ribose 5-phosphate isomerase B [Tannerella sp.]|jgi:ribose 5-phosphate isomerase B|nr:ribose 5-phosphate isomerase B [Tannerella sp.]